MEDRLNDKTKIPKDIKETSPEELELSTKAMETELKQQEKAQTNKFTTLDGSRETEEILTKAFLDSLTEEEKRKAMSDKFSYLDDDI